MWSTVPRGISTIWDCADVADCEAAGVTLPVAGICCGATGVAELVAVADAGGAFEGVAVGDEAAGCWVDEELL
jgi:hypothetical protein